MELFNDSEIEAMIMALARGNNGFTKDEAMKLIHWANNVRIDHAILTSILDGTFDVSFIEDEIALVKRGDKAEPVE